MARGWPLRAILAAGALATVVWVAACSDNGSVTTVTTTDQAGNTVVVTATDEPTQTPEPDEGAPVTADGPVDPVATTLPVPGGDVAPTTAGQEEAVLSTVSVLVPGGWAVQDLGDAEAVEPVAGQVAPHRWCLTPSYAVPAVDDCAGVLVAVGGDWLPGGAGQAYEPGQAEGWRWDAEPLLCPFDQEADPEDEEPNLTVTDAEGAPLTTTETELGGLAATYETWRVTCGVTGETFTPQVWLVPELNVLVKDYFGQADTGMVLDSLAGA